MFCLIVAECSVHSIHLSVFPSLQRPVTMSVTTATATSTTPTSTAAAAADEFDSTPLTHDTLTLPFQLGHIDQLCEVEMRVQQQQQKQGEEAKKDAVADGIIASLDSSTKIDKLAALLHANTHTEDEWQSVVELHDGAIYRALCLTLAYVPLSSAHLQSLLQSLYILGTLLPPQLYIITQQHPASITKLLSSLSLDLPASDLAARLRLLDLILIEAHASKQPMEGGAELIEHVQTVLIHCLAHAHLSIQALATTNMLLLNSVVPRRCLHKLVMSAQSELARGGTFSFSPTCTSSPTAAAASPSSSSSSSLTPPSSPLSTASLSNFSQELITLINQGRLPATWEEEDARSEVRSGTINSLDTVTDMFQSTREVVRAIPDRVGDCPTVTSATLGFIAELFHTNTALDLFYTNDIHVMVEVLIRRIEELQDPMLLLDFLLCLSSIVSWPDFASHPIKLSELRDLLAHLTANHPILPSLDEEEREKMSLEEADLIDTKIALAELSEQISKKLATISP